MATTLIALKFTSWWLSILYIILWSTDTWLEWSSFGEGTCYLNSNISCTKILTWPSSGWLTKDWPCTVSCHQYAGRGTVCCHQYAGRGTVSCHQYAGRALSAAISMPAVALSAAVSMPAVALSAAISIPAVALSAAISMPAMALSAAISMPAEARGHMPHYI